MTTLAPFIVALLLFLPPGRGLFAKEEFPRLLGMNIGEKNYHDPHYQADLAKLDIVILGFYKGWQPKKAYFHGDAVRDIQSQNLNLRIGQYTVLNEARDVQNDTAMADIVGKLNSQQWWLKNADGDRLQWTKKYSAWETNFTFFAQPDANGDRFPQWLAGRNFKEFFSGVPQLRILYTDNVFPQSRVTADWDGDGANDSPGSPRILAAWREGYKAYWAAIRKLIPNVMIMGNADSDLSEHEYAGQLDAAYLEGLMGKPWSLESRRGWAAMMKRYRDVEKNLRDPRVIGFNAWGRVDDFRFFRFAFASCLMGNGYFNFTDEKRGYSSVHWFDEYEVNLGKALEPWVEKPWRNGVWRRDFEGGVVLLNPSDQHLTVELEPGLKRIHGKQDPYTNNGEPAIKVRLAPRDGLVLENK